MLRSTYLKKHEFLGECLFCNNQSINFHRACNFLTGALRAKGENLRASNGSRFALPARQKWRTQEHVLLTHSRSVPSFK